MSKSETTDDTRQSYQSLNISRRKLLQGAGATAGTTAGMAGMNTYAVEEADALAISGTTAIAVGGGLAAGYLINEAAEKFLGESFDSSDYDQAAASETHSGIYNNAVAANGANDTVLTTINNRLIDSENVAWGKGKLKAVNALNNGRSEAEAKTRAKDEVRAYYSTILTNLGNHFKSQVNKFEQWLTLIDNTSGLARTDVIEAAGDSKTATDLEITSGSVTLPDTTTLDLKGVSWTSTYDTSSTLMAHPGGYAFKDAYSPLNIKSTGTDKVAFLGHNNGNNNQRFPELWSTAISKKDTMVSNLDAYVTTLYDNYSSGEIDPSNFLDPSTVASEMGTKESETGNYAYAGAEISMLGLKSSFESLMKVYLYQDDTTVEAQLFFKDGPDGGVKVGEKYQPSQFTGPVYIGWDTGNNEPGFGELEQSFRVEKAEDIDGNEIDTITAKSYNTQTSDVGTTEAELNGIADALDKAKEKQKAEFEEASGDEPMGFSFGGGSGNVILLAGAGLAAYLIGSD